MDSGHAVRLSSNRAKLLSAGALWSAGAILAAGLIVLAFSKSLVELWGSWQLPQYSHGVLIPAIAGLLFWHDLARARPRPQPSWVGLPVLLAGFLLLALGTISTFNSASLYGLILVIAGLVLGFLGGRSCVVALPALAYLCFAIPAPSMLYVDLSQRLQLLSSSLAVDILDMLDVPVVQDGNIIDLGLIKLQVAEACSGLRYVFPLASFSFLAAYLLRDRFWKRAVLFLSAVPIAILLNVTRIVIVGVTAQAWGIGAAQGFLHAFEGWAIFLACVAFLAAETWVLLRVHRTPGSGMRMEYFERPRLELTAAAPKLQPAGIATFALLAILAPAASPLLAQADTAASVGAGTVATLPLSVGAWHGRPHALDPDVIDALELTDYTLAEFREGNDPAIVEYYMAYYRQQRVGSAVHSPANCIPGGGWAIETHAIVSVPTGQTGKSLRVNRMLISNDHQHRLVYYWFAQRGRDLTDEWQVKWFLLRDRMITGRSDGYLVRLVTPVEDGQVAAADRRLQRLLSAATPYLPD